MLKYLIIQLDDSSVSFCHYNNDRTKAGLIPLDKLKEAIFWSMKENLTLQFLYPDYSISEKYKSEIAKTFHADIVSSICEDETLRTTADVVIFDSLASINFYPFNKAQSYVFRLTISELIDNIRMIYPILPQVDRINIVLTDILSFKEKEDKTSYMECLNSLSDKIVNEYKSGHSVQVNLLTDRILLDGMNNCNAGEETITLCPDGNFYVCPGFYSDGDKRFMLGNVKQGLQIRNPQLYKLDHAPICKICDAYQCQRCVWLNSKSTHEVNTPGREQCVISHIDRNSSRELLKKIREIGQFMPEKKIEHLDYLDPLEKLLMR